MAGSSRLRSLLNRLVNRPLRKWASAKEVVPCCALDGQVKAQPVAAWQEQLQQQQLQQQQQQSPDCSLSGQPQPAQDAAADAAGQAEERVSAPPMQTTATATAGARISLEAWSSERPPLRAAATCQQLPQQQPAPAPAPQQQSSGRALLRGNMRDGSGGGGGSSKLPSRMLSLKIQEELAQGAESLECEAITAAHSARLLSPASNPRSVRHSLAGTAPPPATPPVTEALTPVYRAASRRPATSFDFRRGSLEPPPPAALNVRAPHFDGDSLSAPVRKLRANTTFPHSASYSPFSAAAPPAPAHAAFSAPGATACDMPSLAERKSGTSSRLHTLLLALHGAGANAAALRQRRRASSCNLSLPPDNGAPAAAGSTTRPRHRRPRTPVSPGSRTPAPASGATPLPRAASCAVATPPTPPPTTMLLRNVRWYSNSGESSPGGEPAESARRWAPHEESSASPFAASHERRASAAAVLAARAAEYAAVANKDGSLARLVRQMTAFHEEHRSGEHAMPAEAGVEEDGEDEDEDEEEGKAGGLLLVEEEEDFVALE